MRVQLYNQLMAMQSSRRQVLKGAAGAAAALAASSPLGSLTSAAFAEDSVVAQIMKIPGAGNGSPTDSDWQKVGELCLGPTKATVKPGEFKGVEFSFMGLNNQNLHNFLFRGFLTPWEAYTGAKIKWIDLAQGDYNARLQQSIATGTVDYDIIEMGAPFEGDMGVKDLLSEMPDWVKTQIEFDDIVNYLKPPVGAWNGKIHRVTIDSDCHTMNIRTSVFADPDLAKAWKAEGGKGEWGVPKTWQQVQAVTKFLKGKKVKGKDVYGFLDQPKPWGGFQFYFTASRATAYAKYPGEKNWLFDENMKPQVNNPAFVRAIQDIVDALPFQPADQINADPGATAFQQFLTGTGSLLEWWGDIGTVAKTSDTATIGDDLSFDILPGSDDVYNFRKKAWEFVVLRVGGHPPDLGHRLAVEAGEQLGGGLGVIDGGGRHEHGRQQAHAIDDNVALPPVDVLGIVAAPLLAAGGRVDRLAVDAGGGPGVVGLLDGADLAAEQVMDDVQRAVATPLVEISPHGAPGRQIDRQVAPLAAGAKDVEDGIDDVAHWSVLRGRPPGGAAGR